MSYERYARRLPNDSCIAYIPVPGDPWTIGYGSTGPDIGPSTIWTRSQAVNRFGETFQNCIDGVLRASPHVSGNRLEALADFAYNCGIGAYQTSTLRRYVNQCRWTDASNEFGKWVFAHGVRLNGLVRRRAAERALFLTPDQPAAQQFPPSIQSPPATWDGLWAGFLRWLLAATTTSRADDSQPSAKP